MTQDQTSPDKSSKEAGTDAATAISNEQTSRQPNEAHQSDAPGTGFAAVVGSFFAALFGIQSARNRERDFKKGRAEDYIVVGVIGVIVLVIGMVVVVNGVISSAG